MDSSERRNIISQQRKDKELSSKLDHILIVANAISEELADVKAQLKELDKQPPKKRAAPKETE